MSDTPPKPPELPSDAQACSLDGMVLRWLAKGRVRGRPSCPCGYVGAARTIRQHRCQCDVWKYHAQNYERHARQAQNDPALRPPTQDVRGGSQQQAGSASFKLEPAAASGTRRGLVGVGGVKPLRVLVACECSGVVRNAFAALGHDAWSCDIVPSETPGNHLQCSVLDVKVVKRGWDLMIAHPDCTFLTVSGARWMSEEWREEAQLAALHFVKALWKFPVPRIAIENPVGRLSSLWRGASQYIQPWQFGHGETKTTGLWLKGLPPLLPTEIVEEREQRVFKMAPSETRKRDRSRTYEGIALAMALQWGGGGPRRWRDGDRVTRELYMDDGTWARLGDKCLPHSPRMHGVVMHRDPRRQDGVWVRWDFDGSMSMYLDHGLDAEEAHIAGDERLRERK